MANEKKDKKNNKDKRHFWKDFKAELKKVIWPTPKQLLNNTVAVVTIVLVTAIIVFALDMAFEALNKYGINKLKDAIESNPQTSQNNETENNTENTENQETSQNNTVDEQNNGEE